MPCSPITSWQVDGEKVEAVTDFIFPGSKITVSSGWTHEIKRCLLYGKKAMTNLDSVLKSRDITLPTKFRIVEAMVFLIVTYGCSVGPYRGLSTEELMFSNCSVGKDS